MFVMCVFMSGIIQLFDLDVVIVVVQLVIKGVEKDEFGVQVLVNFLLLVDVFVVFFCGGGCMLIFFVKSGDECFVIFVDCCIDFWW